MGGKRWRGVGGRRRVRRWPSRRSGWEEEEEEEEEEEWGWSPLPLLFLFFL